MWLRLRPPQLPPPPASVACRRSWMSTTAVADTTAPVDPPVKVRVLGMYSVNRVKLVELERLVQRNDTGRQWRISSDRNWTTFSLRPSERVLSQRAPPMRRKASHVAVSKRGPVVCVNCDLDKAAQVLSSLYHPAVSTPFSKEDQVFEYMNVIVDPGAADAAGRRGGDLVLQRLDIDSVGVLATVMAQTVVLQYHEERMDRLHDVATSLNKLIEHKKLHTTTNQRLYRLLAENNSITGDMMLSGIRTIARPGTASWKNERFEELETALADDLELAERYEELEAKMAYVNDLLKYCLHVKNEDTLERLELKIVYILTLEACLSLMGLLTGQHYV